MPVSSQMLKGVLEGCVLALIARGETYGYELVGTLAGCGLVGIAEGTLYPLLMRLEKKGFIVSEYRASEMGPRRKYYAVTPAGEAEVARFAEDFASLTDVVGRVLEDGPRPMLGRAMAPAGSVKPEGASAPSMFRAGRKVTPLRPTAAAVPSASRPTMKECHE